MRHAGLLFLFAAVVLSTESWAADEPLPLYEAVERKLIEVKGQSAGDHTAAKLHIENKSKEVVRVDVMGSYLEPVRGDRQRLALSFTPRSNQHVVTLEPTKEWTGTVQSFCMDAGIPAPNRATPMRLAPRPVPAIIHEVLVYWVTHDAIPQSTVQSAVWSLVSLPHKLRDIKRREAAAKDALKAEMERHREHLIATLRKQVDMAITGEGHVFFGTGTLDDLRALGVAVPDIGKSLVIAAPDKEVEQPLSVDKDDRGETIRLRRYHMAAGHVFATGPGGLYRWTQADKHWIREAPVHDVRRVVGQAGGPFAVLTVDGGVYYKSKLAGKLALVGGPYTDLVLAPMGGDPVLIGLNDHRKRFFSFDADTKQWTAAMNGSPAYTYGRTEDVLFRFGRARGDLSHYDASAGKWRRVAGKLANVWFGKTHVWMLGRDRSLSTLSQAGGKPVRIRKKVEDHALARVRYGTDQLYLKIRAHLVMVLGPEPHLEEAR